MAKTPKRLDLSKTNFLVGSDGLTMIPHRRRRVTVIVSPDGTEVKLFPQGEDYTISYQERLALVPEGWKQTIVWQLVPVEKK